MKSARRSDAKFCIFTDKEFDSHRPFGTVSFVSEGSTYHHPVDIPVDIALDPDRQIHKMRVIDKDACSIA